MEMLARNGGQKRYCLHLFTGCPHFLWTREIGRTVGVPGKHLREDATEDASCAGSFADHDAGTLAKSAAYWSLPDQPNFGSWQQTMGGHP